MYWLELQLAAQRQEDLRKEAELERLLKDLRAMRENRSPRPLRDLLRDMRLGISANHRPLPDLNTNGEPCPDPC